MIDERKIKAAEWFERLALAVVAVLVIERVFTGASLTDKDVASGIIAALGFYFFAFFLLIKSKQ